uniref:Uncharacterized protein n=1 Tax=Mesocestoides corti TaxID=53468 RepID=A0A5K3FZ64_MESCO
MTALSENIGFSKRRSCRTNKTTLPTQFATSSRLKGQACRFINYISHFNLRMTRRESEEKNFADETGVAVPFRSPTTPLTHSSTGLSLQFSQSLSCSYAKTGFCRVVV